MHAARVRRHGDPAKVIQVSERRIKRKEDHPQWSERPTRNAVHMRIRAERGSAARHNCVACGRRAAHWAFFHNREFGIPDLKGHYSLVVADYEPMCVRCHKQMDNDYRKEARTIRWADRALAIDASNGGAALRVGGTEHYIDLREAVDLWIEANGDASDQQRGDPR